MNLIQIAKSWFNFATADGYTKMVMNKRLAICDTCPEKTQLNALGQAIIQMVNEEGSTYYCASCGCPLAAKTAGLGNECPLRKWGVAGGSQSYF